MSMNWEAKQKHSSPLWLTGKKFQRLHQNNKQETKAENFASWLSKWKQITTVKWVLSTFTGTNIEFVDITQIPLSNEKTKLKVFFNKK